MKFFWILDLIFQHNKKSTFKEEKEDLLSVYYGLGALYNLTLVQ